MHIFKTSPKPFASLSTSKSPLRLFAGEYGNLPPTVVASLALLPLTSLLADPRTRKGLSSPTETFLPHAARSAVASRPLPVPPLRAATPVNALPRLRQPARTTTSTTTSSPMTILFLPTPKDPLLPLRLLRRNPTIPSTRP